MKFTIYDVGHGLCSLAILDNNKAMVFDCGHNATTDRRPSDFLIDAGVLDIEWFLITNYDEDHISDHANLISRYGDAQIRSLHRNTSISASEVRKKKLDENGEVSPAMESVCRMIERYTGSFGPGEAPDLGRANLKVFWNTYRSDFDDMNNISLVAFLSEGDHQVVIPGDLEKAGWERLLRLSPFRQALEDTTLFVASHHGRRNGYCEKVFDYCEPIWVIMSDGPKEHGTQEMADTYASHARGADYGGRSRRVLTTRRDGDITLQW